MSVEICGYTIATTGTNRCSAHCHHTGLVSPICARRFHRHCGGRPALLNRYSTHCHHTGLVSPICARRFHSRHCGGRPALLNRHYRGTTHGTQYRIHDGLVCVPQPPGAAFQARLLENQEGANTERYVFGKLSARCVQRRPTAVEIPSTENWSRGG